MNDKSIAEKKVLSNRVTVQAIYDRSLIFNRKKGKIFCDGIDFFYSNVATTLTLYNAITRTVQCRNTIVSVYLLFCYRLCQILMGLQGRSTSLVVEFGSISVDFMNIEYKQLVFK